MKALTVSEADVATAQRELCTQGYSIIVDVLSPREVKLVRARLMLGAEEHRARNIQTHFAIDPSDRNVRVFHLLQLDRIFRDLIAHPLALRFVQGLLGDQFLISNFTANVALPGSGSMRMHSDQALVVPEPWVEPWSVNIIWCLDDIDVGNGATRYVPGSHRWARRADLPAIPEAGLQSFTAKAGSIIAMDGRVWHTSGANTSTDRERALLFGYYSRAFLRPQVDWYEELSPAVRDNLSPLLKQLLGFRVGNVHLAEFLQLPATVS